MSDGPEDHDNLVILMLHGALQWLVNVGHDTGRGGGRPEPDEFRAAMSYAEKALDRAEKLRRRASLPGGIYFDPNKPSALDKIIDAAAEAENHYTLEHLERAAAAYAGMTIQPPGGKVSYKIGTRVRVLTSSQQGGLIFNRWDPGYTVFGYAPNGEGYMVEDNIGYFAIVPRDEVRAESSWD